MSTINASRFGSSCKIFWNGLKEILNIYDFTQAVRPPFNYHNFPKTGPSRVQTKKSKIKSRKSSQEGLLTSFEGHSHDHRFSHRYRRCHGNDLFHKLVKQKHVDEQ